jgi:hypothetical protein
MPLPKLKMDFAIFCSVAMETRVQPVAMEDMHAPPRLRIMFPIIR